MGEFQIVVEPNVRRRRCRQSLSKKRRAAILFKVWHGIRELIEEGERIGEGELVHFLAVAQLLVEEKTVGLTSNPAFEAADTSLPN